MSESYIPPFTITDKMVDRISEISEMLGTISVINSMNKNPKLRRDNRIKSIHSSLAIENNSLTLSQVKDIINGKTVLGPINEILEVKNAYKAYNLLDELNPYSLESLFTAHKVMMKDLIAEPGNFRNGGVGVFAGERLIHMAPPAEFVQSQIHDLLSWCETASTHPLIKSSVFHFEFEFIHPFADGNGRMGRLWQTLILSRWNPVFVWMPVESLILSRQREYYDALGVSGKSGNSNVFIEFMLDTIWESLSALKSGKVNETVNDTVSETVNEIVNEIVNDTVNETERALISVISKNPSVTILQMIAVTGFSRSTVTRSLASLKQKGVIVRVGSDKKGYWEVR